jgi:hypothetical protein
MEVPTIAHFLNEFEFSIPTIKPSIKIDDNWEYIMIKNFPLSDEFCPDHEDITIVTGTSKNHLFQIPFSPCFQSTVNII